MRRLLRLSAPSSHFLSTYSKVRVGKSITANTPSHSSVDLLLKEFNYVKSRVLSKASEKQLESSVTTITDTKISRELFDFDRLDVRERHYYKYTHHFLYY